MTFKNKLPYAGLPTEVYAICLSRVINCMGSFVMPLLTLILTQKIGFTKVQAGLFTSLLITTQAPFLLLGGSICDRIGGKRAIVIFETFGAFGYLACAFMKPSFAMAVMIAVAADLYTIAGPAFGKIIAGATPPEDMQQAYSLQYLGMNVGLAIGPMVGGLLFNGQLGLLFGLDALTTLAATALLFIAVKERKPGSKQTELNETGKPRPTVPASTWAVFKKYPVLPIFSLIMMIYCFCYSQWTFILPLQSAELFHGVGAQFFSALMSLNAVEVILITPLLASVMKKHGVLSEIALGGLLYAAAFGLFAFHLKAMALYAAGVAVMTAGEVFVSINMNTFIVERTPEAYLGRVNSVLSVLSGTGNAIGPMIMGGVLTGVGYHFSWAIIALLMFLGAVSILLLRRFPQNDPTAKPTKECANAAVE